MEALGIFPGVADDAAKRYVLESVRSVLPFLDESTVGEPAWRTGAAPSFTRERLERSQREARLAAGWRGALFVQQPFTFLRNEEYAAAPLAEALLSGALAV